MAWLLWNTPKLSSRSRKASQRIRSHARADDPLASALSDESLKTNQHSPFWRSWMLVSVDHAMRTGQAEQGLLVLLPSIAQWPKEERLQVLAARCVQKLRAPDKAALVWRSLLDRFPDNHEAFRLVNRALIREEGHDCARQHLNAHLPDTVQSARQFMTRAQCFEDLHNHKRADVAWEQALKLGHDDKTVLFGYGASLEKRGYLFDAYDAYLEAQKQDSQSQVLKDRIAHLDRIAHFKPVNAPMHDRIYAQTLVIEKIIETAGKNRKAMSISGQNKKLGKIILINSSLGPGGAERQFVNTAIGLQKQIQSGKIVGSVEVWCRSFSTRVAGDFFLHKLEEAGIKVREYNDFPGVLAAIKSPSLAPYVDLVDFLPTQILAPTLKLTDELTRAKPDIVHIWQDGSIAATGIAALIAQVPVIALGFRSLPPPDKGRDRAYFLPLIQGLAKQTGVILATNSQAGRARYSAWLEHSENDFHVISNGISAGVKEPTEKTVQTAVEFLEDQDKADMGVIMRFDENKRPESWLQIAALVRKTRPAAKFIMVGDGPLLNQTRELAQELGLDDSVLFTGKSNEVSYWLEKMRCFVLLSKIEGVPNAVIEAQMAGLPVITTPAGGSAEAYVPDVSGILLSGGEEVDIKETVDAVISLLMDSDKYSAMSEAAAKAANSKFSMNKMIKNTIDFYGSASR